MGFFSKTFGNKDKEKKEYIDKLIPYKDLINNFDDVINQLKDLGFDDIKQNVDKIINEIDFENEMERKYGEEIGHKICQGYWIGMSEEQFDDSNTYRVICGKEKIYSHLKGGKTNPYPFRKVNILKTKEIIVRSNHSRKKRGYKKMDFVFENDELVKMKEN